MNNLATTTKNLAGDAGEALGIPLIKAYFSKLQKTRDTSGTKDALKDLLRTFQAHASGKLVNEQQAVVGQHSKDRWKHYGTLLDKTKAFDKTWEKYLAGIKAHAPTEDMLKLENAGAKFSKEQDAARQALSTADIARDAAKTKLDDFKRKHKLVRNYSTAGAGLAGLGALSALPDNDKTAGWVGDLVEKAKKRFRQETQKVIEGHRKERAAKTGTNSSDVQPITTERPEASLPSDTTLRVKDGPKAMKKF